MLARAGCSAARPAMRHARAGVLRGARRSAAAAAVFAAAAQLLGQAQRRCSPIACSAATDKADYLAFDHPLQQAIRRAVARFTGVAEARLVAGIDGCSAPNYAVPLRVARARVRAARERRRRRRLRHGAAHAGRRDDRPPGNGVGRAPQRPRADAGGPRRLGHQDRRRRRAGDRRPQPGHRHRDQGRRRAASAACIRRSSPCSTQLGLLDADARDGAGAMGAAARSATTAASRPAKCEPAVVLGRRSRRVSRDFPHADELNFGTREWSVAASVRRVASTAPRRGPASCRRQPRPPFGGHNNE